MNRDLVFGAMGALVAAGYYVMAAGIRESALADTVGPQGLPKVYGFVLLLLSVILIARSFRRNTDSGSRIPDPGSRIGRVLGMLAIGIVYLLLVPWLGYVVTLAGLIFAATWYQAGFANRTIAIVAISGAVLFWLLFVVLLGIPHPPGMWARLF